VKAIHKNEVYAKEILENQLFVPVFIFVSFVGLLKC